MQYRLHPLSHAGSKKKEGIASSTNSEERRLGRLQEQEKWSYSDTAKKANFTSTTTIPTRRRYTGIKELEIPLEGNR